MGIHCPTKKKKKNKKSIFTSPSGDSLCMEGSLQENLRNVDFIPCRQVC